MSHTTANRTKSAGPDRLAQPDPLLTTLEAARQFGVTNRTIQLWVDSGKLQGVRTPGGHRRIHQSAVTALREKMAAAAGPADVYRERAELMVLARALDALPDVLDAPPKNLAVIQAARALAISIIRRDEQ